MNRLNASNTSSSTWVAGTDGPELTRVRIGFIPLTDCAPVIVAAAMGFDRKHGIEIVPSREASWATVRDKVVNGELDMAHALYGLVYGVHLGLSGPRTDMAVLMTINQNGQGLSLSRRLHDKGVRDLDSLKALMAREPRDYVFAQTFPTGTHAMWLYYWLAAAGIHPFDDVRSIVVPPAQMVSHARAGHMDGFSVGEPWNHKGIVEGVSIHAAASQDIWPDHPEKVLGASAAFVDAHPNTCRAVIMALLEACRWIDASDANRLQMAELIAGKSYVNTSVDTISARILGHYQDGLGNTWHDPRHLRFHAEGAVNFPYLSDGMWFMTQYKRWGFLSQHPDYLSIASRMHRISLYREAAEAVQVPIPALAMRTSTLIDGVTWNGSNPAEYADQFVVHVADHPVAA